MKTLIISMIFLFSCGSMAALLPATKDVRNRSSQLEVLPPMGFLGCEECENPYMGGVKGASYKDAALLLEHERIIFGGATDQYGKTKAAE